MPNHGYQIWRCTFRWTFRAKSYNEPSPFRPPAVIFIFIFTRNLILYCKTLQCPNVVWKQTKEREWEKNTGDILWFSDFAESRCGTRTPKDNGKEKRERLFLLFSTHRHFKLLAGFGDFNGQMSDHHHTGNSGQDHVAILLGQHNHRDAGKSQTKAADGASVTNTFYFSLF